VFLSFLYIKNKEVCERLVEINLTSFSNCEVFTDKLRK
jgi:hypothetical protein